MVAYSVSNQSDLMEEEKLNLIEGYSVGDLLKVLRDFEDNPRDFSPEVIKLIGEKLYDKGIMCM